MDGYDTLSSLLHPKQNWNSLVVCYFWTLHTAPNIYIEMQKNWELPKHSWRTIGDDKQDSELLLQRHTSKLMEQNRKSRNRPIKTQTCNL